MLDHRLVKVATKLSAPAGARLALGIPELDEQLGGGLPLSAITEIVSEDGHGGYWLAMRALAQVKGRIGLLNHDDSFHPPGAALLGVDLSKLLVVRAKERKDSLWALERLAKNAALAATFAWLPKLKDVDLRRLQLASERSRQTVLLLRDPEEAGRSSWGALRLKVRAVPAERGPGRGGEIEVTTLRARGGSMPRPVRIEVEDGTGAVRGATVVPHRALDAEPRARA
jgi:protein ImuA